MKLVSFAIPVYNNQESLKILHQNIKNEMTANFPDFNYEIVFVNDGSKDNSLKEIKECRASDPNVKYISLSRNFKHIGAINAGIQASKGDAVINMSADLQDPVEQCTKMIKEWLNGYEVVISYREARKDPVLTKVTSKIAYSLFKRELPNMPVGGFDFALLDRKAVNAYNSIQSNIRWFQGDVLRIGFKLKYIPYNRLERPFGKSQFTFRSRLRAFITLYLSISYLPIRLMSVAGFLTASWGFIYAIGIIFTYFAHHTPFKGWAPIMILLLIIGGMIMLMLGIIGEYIWRIYDEVKIKPPYIIAEQDGI